MAGARIELSGGELLAMVFDGAETFAPSGPSTDLAPSGPDTGLAPSDPTPPSPPAAGLT
jgi:hypothetical protein